MNAPRGSVSVIGGGLSGLTAALALLRSGWQVRVFEQASELGEVGAGITLSPGAGRALASLGIEEALLAESLPIPDIAFVHYSTGELLAGRFDRGCPADHGVAAPRHIHRADLHAILVRGVRACDPNAIVTGKRLVGMAQDGQGVTVKFDDGSMCTADLAVAADGARSTVRRHLFDEIAPRFAGQIAFRCLIPRAQAAPYMGKGNAVVSVGAARIFNRYLIRRGTLVNVIGIAKNTQWQSEGWSCAASVDEFLQQYKDFHDDVRGLIRLAPHESLIKWGLFIRDPVTQWSADRVVLIGDAAHPILPFLGLGAALAIEDGIVLARALRSYANPPHAFKAFERTRAERVATVHAQSILQGEIIQATDPDQAELRHSPSQNSTLFDYDPTAVPLHV